jgi:uncharacterized protein
LSYLYLDTSAVVKRYNPETGSAWITTLLDPSSGHSIVLSEITMAEFAAAISAKRRAGLITPVEQARVLALFLSHCTAEYELVAVSRTIVERAVLLTQNHKLRGYDAVQLASALVTKEVLAGTGLVDFSFVTADSDLLQAAQLERLVVENPELHP